MSGQADQNQIYFSSRPTAEEGGARVSIVRTPAGRSMSMIVLSHDAVGVYTHYYRGLTRPCMGGGCEACEHDSSMRWHGYLGVQGMKSGDLGVFEFTAPGADACDQFLKLHGTLRGAQLIASRAGQRENSRIVLRFSTSDRAPLLLPAAPDVRQFLFRLWSVTSPKEQRNKFSVGGEIDLFNPEPHTGNDKGKKGKPGTNPDKKDSTNGDL